MKTEIFKNPEATAKAFADHLVEKLTQVNRLNIALSGGSTPKLLFSLLAEKYADKIDWTKLQFYWGDERCVPPTDDDSNFKMTQERLFSQVNLPEENVHRVLGENDPTEEAQRYGELINDNLPSVNGLPQFDIIMLGMGEDGHTASIFPHQLELLKDSNTCAVAVHPESGQKRVTLNGPVINNAKEVCFLVTGEGKAEKIEEIFNFNGKWQSYPAAHIKPEHGDLIWFMDKAAASKL